MIPGLKRYKIIKIEEPAATEKITIRLGSQWGGMDESSESLKYLLEKFMTENPGIIVENESVSASGFDEKLSIDIASGNIQDIILCYPGYESKRYIKNGQFAPLTGILEENKEWTDSLDASIWYNVSYNGQIYGVPMESIFQCMYLNKELFDLYGIAVPRTFDELLAACREFAQRGIVPLAYTFQDEEAYLYQNLLARIGGSFDGAEAIDRGDLTCYQQALYYLKQLYEAGAFHQDVFHMGYSEAVDLFLQKQAAMIVGDTKLIGYINGSQRIFENTKNGDIPIEMIPFPMITGGNANSTSIIYGSGMTMYMSTQASNDPDKREAVVKLMKYLTGEEAATRFSEYAGIFVSTKSVLFSAAYYDGLLKRGNDLLAATKELITPPTQTLPSAVWTGLCRQIPLVIYGTQTEEEMWNDIISKYNTETGKYER